MASFHRDARTVSAKTYQERLLGAGLPDGPEALAGMQVLARRDAARGWLLFVDGEPVSYLYAPADGETLIYAWLGYDPAFADFSPGSVLQLEAMRRLMAEGRFRLFDFTEGDGQHKRLFATAAVDCVDLLMVRPTLANLAVAGALNGFDGAVALAKSFVSRIGGKGFGAGCGADHTRPGARAAVSAYQAKPSAMKNSLYSVASGSSVIAGPSTRNSIWPAELPRRRPGTASVPRGHRAAPLRRRKRAGRTAPASTRAATGSRFQWP